MGKNLLKNKKGIALNQAFGAVLALVLIATLVIIAIVLFVSLNNSFTNVETVRVLNETATALNATGYTVVNATACNFAGMGDLFIVNESSGTFWAAGNYSGATDTGIITATVAGDADLNFNNSVNNISYSFNWGSEACVAGQNLITQFATYPTLVGLVGTIIFLGLVIGVLVASFVFGGRRRV